VLPWLLQHTTARIVGGCAGGTKPLRERPGGLARLEALPWRHGAPAEAVRLMWLRPLEIKKYSRSPNFLCFPLAVIFPLSTSVGMAHKSALDGRGTRRPT
jgi:hypothetical protein